MNIIKILKTNGKIFDGNLEEAGNHYYVYFKCEKCGKETKKQKRRIKINGFFCSECLSHKKHTEEIKKKIGEASKRNNNIQLMKNSLLKSDGVDNASKINSVIKKRQRTKRIKLLPDLYKRIIENGYTPLFTLEDYIGQRVNGKNIKYNFIHDKCNTKFSASLNGHLPRCPLCYPVSSSIAEKEIVDFIKSLNIKNVIENDRTILDGKELDIYLPDYNLAIEFDGLYWHSESQGKDKNYHLDKTNKCNEKNIQLIHIFEDEWLDKKEIIKSILRVRLGIIDNKIYARKCIIKEVENREAKIFLENNHLQGKVNGKIRLGLYYNDELVSLLTFGKSRFNKNYDWELLRFANKLNTSVVGGFAKLLKYFKSNQSGKIITYSDKRYFNGKIYENNGFKTLLSSSPNYYYIKNNIKYNRIKFQKHKLNSILENFNNDLTESQNMLLNGYDRIWDCGNNVFVL